MKIIVRGILQKLLKYWIIRRQDDRPSNPATQLIILEIDWFLDTNIAFMYYPVLFKGNCTFLKFTLIFPSFGEFGEPKFALLENFYGTCLTFFCWEVLWILMFWTVKKAWKYFLKSESSKIKNLPQTEVIDLL